MGPKQTEPPPPAYESLYPPGEVSSDYGAFGSSETVKSELAIFDGLSYQVTHTKAQWLDVYPENQYQGTSGSNIKFKIVGSPGWYLDFNDSFMMLTFKLQDDKGADVKDQLVAVENFVLATMFKDVSLVTANQTKLEGENQNYAYRTYMYALLNASAASKQNQLTSFGWVKDDAGV